MDIHVLVVINRCQYFWRLFIAKNREIPCANLAIWRDLREEPLHFSNHNFWGGSVMVWAAFSAMGKLHLVLSKVKSAEYIEVCWESLLSFTQDWDFPGFIQISLGNSKEIFSPKITWFESFFHYQQSMVMQWQSRGFVPQGLGFESHLEPIYSQIAPSGIRTRNLEVTKANAGDPMDEFLGAS